MTYCLDTDTCIFALRDRFPSVKKWFQRFSADHIKIPSIVQAELVLGALKSSSPKDSLHLVERFLGPFEIIAFGSHEAIVYAKVKADLERNGSLIGPNDLIIAATAMARQATLVTHNTKEFSRVNGLLMEDWTE